jgi:hypothetical protein
MSRAGQMLAGLQGIPTVSSVSKDPIVHCVLGKSTHLLAATALG